MTLFSHDDDDEGKIFTDKARIECSYDPVNQPLHYKGGKVEAIDVIEDAVAQTDEPIYGYLQGQTLKYLLRMWLKGDALQDAKKARWYLDRLIGKLEGVD